MRLPFVRRGEHEGVLQSLMQDRAKLAAARDELPPVRAALVTAVKDHAKEKARADEAERLLENAREHLRLAQSALLADGYFTPDQVSDDIAPRIHERLSALRQELREAQAAVKPELTADEVRFYYEVFQKSGGIQQRACETCGGIHVRACPRVRSVEYDRAAGTIFTRRVEYWAPGKWDDSGIVFADQLPDPEEAEPAEESAGA